jgi:signal transduction histidine kinase
MPDRIIGIRKLAVKASQWLNRKILILVGSLLVLLFLPILAWNGLILQGNASALDILLRLSRPRLAAAQNHVVLLAVDDETVRRYGPLPIDRAILANGLNVVARAGAKILVVDLLLSERTEETADASLAEALGHFPKVVLATALEATQDGAPSQWIYPIPDFERRAFALGHVHLEPERDGVARNLLLAKSAGEVRHWALAFESFRAMLDVTVPPVEHANELRLGDRRVPASNATGRLMWIHYAGKEGTFSRVSLASVLEGRTSPSTFAGMVVILGVTAQGGGDRVFTPFSAGMGMSGIEVHANIFSTLLDRAFLTPIGPVVEYLWLILIAALVAGAAWWRNGRLLAPVAFAGIVAIPVFSYWALNAGLIFPVVSALITEVAVSLACFLAHSITIGRQLGEAVEGQQDYAFRLQAVAHEIKTPLTAIHASSELMTDADVPEQKKEEIAQRIHKESGRLSSVVTTFLDVERISAGVLKLEKKPVELCQLVAEACERASLLALKKKIAIEQNCTSVVFPADAELLLFAIYNLLSNAIKYSPSGSSISISLRIFPEEVCLVVADSGCGIAPSEQSEIFRPFYRSQNHRDDRDSGSGVGLAIVKQIVAQHGGRIEVKSVPEAGSSFSVFLPREEGK